MDENKFVLFLCPAGYYLSNIMASYFNEHLKSHSITDVTSMAKGSGYFNSEELREMGLDSRLLGIVTFDETSYLMIKECIKNKPVLKYNYIDVYQDPEKFSGIVYDHIICEFAIVAKNA